MNEWTAWCGFIQVSRAHPSQPFIAHARHVEYFLHDSFQKFFAVKENYKLKLFLISEKNFFCNRHELINWALQTQPALVPWRNPKDPITDLRLQEAHVWKNVAHKYWNALFWTDYL